MRNSRNTHTSENCLNINEPAALSFVSKAVSNFRDVSKNLSTPLFGQIIRAVGYLICTMQSYSTIFKNVKAGPELCILQEFCFDLSSL